MNPDPSRAEALFLAAAAIAEPQERAAFLDRECGDDLALRARVDGLLASHDEAGNFLQPIAPSPEMEREFARLKPEEAGERIGHYKLLQQIGEGGFGVVWMAEQEQPVRRRVALKIIKMGMDTKEVIARFEQERQALAMMDHPNIAKVFDAGATPFGRPYFVMELVRGIKITDYCDQASLPTADRLQLFIAVCQAVQHAHQKGIIHRDLKPSNILVTLHDGVPVPKVIDFGVAKAIQARLTERTLFTQFEQMIGTPLYMSPEQAELSGLDIDTRSDIYSLGVLLYELLTGRTPVDAETLQRAGLDEIRRIIREEEPPRPSMALQTMAAATRTAVAGHRHVEPPHLIGLLRGDLDWIVMKSIEKDRSRRYDTATALAEDLRRHLVFEPVVARPPGRLYRFRRMVKRNRLAFVAAAAVLVAVLAGAGVSVWQAVRARHEAQRAGAAEQRAVDTLSRLTATAPSFCDQARLLIDKGELPAALEKIDLALTLRPTDASFHTQRGHILQSLSRFSESVEAYTAALRLDPQDASATANLDLSRELALAKAAEKVGPIPREAQRRWRHALIDQGRHSEAISAPKVELPEFGKTLPSWQAKIDSWLGKDAPRIKFYSDFEPYGLDLSNRGVSDLSPLRGMVLASLDISWNGRVKDLSPLADAMLWELVASGAGDLTDLSPLRFKDIQILKINYTSVTDLEPLSRMRTLRSFHCGNTEVADLSPLRNTRLKVLKIPDTKVNSLEPVRGHPLEELGIDGTQIADLTPLQGAKLYWFTADACPKLRSLEPLRGQPLRRVHLSRAKVESGGLEPISQAALEDFHIENFDRIDLSELNIHKLRVFRAHGTEVDHLELLAEMQALEVITLPKNLTDPTILRKLPRLRKIDTVSSDGFPLETQLKDAEVFWREYDAAQKGK